MSQLKVSVGPGKPNKKFDVLLLQKLLNTSLTGIQKEPLRLDGVFGPKTAADILAYQALVVGIERPDGVVDPGEKTIKCLLRGGLDQRQGQTATVCELANPSGGSGELDGKSRPKEVESFIAMALPAARNVKRDWGVPVAVTLAQSGLSTGWGMHVKGNAYFGIQAKVLTMGSTQLAVPEVIEGKRVGLRKNFRAYADYAESADSYGRYLNETPRYRAAFRYQDDPVQFARTLAAASLGNNQHHEHVLTRVLETYRLDEYDR